MLSVNLQRFAGDRTERATDKRREEVRREGNIPKSAELTSSLGFLAAVMGLRVFGPTMWSGFQALYVSGLTSLTAPAWTVSGVQALFDQLLWGIIRLVGPLVAVIFGVGAMAAYGQVGSLFLPQLLAPKFNRISPIQGFKRLFSLRSSVEAIKSILKLSIVALVTFFSLHGVVNQIMQSGQLGLTVLPSVVGTLIFRIALEIGALMLALSAGDALWQRFEFERGIRMSKQEIKDERKQQEGDPAIRSNIRKRGYALAFRRMMQAVPDADVIITNPTHFAVALKYEAGMTAPIVVAKGQDELARKIRQIAKEASVPFVENKPLAQSLFKTVEIGQVVPKELYAAVAEVLAYVYRMRTSG